MGIIVGQAPTHRIPIPLELVREAYRLMQSNIRGQLVGVFQCLPHSWYAWEEVFEDDMQRRSVMVFDNQTEQLAGLLAAFPTPESVPEEVSESMARALIQKHFADVPDPLPRWGDIKALLDVRRKGCVIHNYTFDEKDEFDPQTIARLMVDKDMALLAQQSHLQAVWDAKVACRSVYRDDQRAFIEDVTRELNNIMSPPKAAVASARQARALELVLSRMQSKRAAPPQAGWKHPCATMKKRPGGTTHLMAA